MAGEEEAIFRAPSFTSLMTSLNACLFERLTADWNANQDTDAFRSLSTKRIESISGRCAVDSVVGPLYSVERRVLNHESERREKRATRGPEAGINDGTCGTRSPRYCRPRATARREKGREKERATPTAHIESSWLAIDSS